MSHVNCLNNKLSVASANVKEQPQQTYCCLWYSCQTWDLVSKSAQSMAVQWNKAVRCMLGIPYTTHTALLPGITGSKPFRKQHMTQVFKLISSFLNSKNEHAWFGTVCRLGCKWAGHVMPVMPVPPCADSLARSQVIWEQVQSSDSFHQN